MAGLVPAIYAFPFVRHKEFWRETLSKEFHFRAPTLFDAGARATVKEKEALHDAPSAAEAGVKTKKGAFWLKSKMVNKGLAVNDPELGEDGWQFSVPPGGGPFVLCILGGSPDDESLFELLVTGIGGATEDVVADAIEHILRNASEVTELTVD
jgi:hypothetical protein